MAGVRDVTGQRFGMLTALEPTEKRYRDGSVAWKFRCDCGNVVERSKADVVSGNTRSCGCLTKKKRDITGKKFGMLTALEPTEKRCGTSVVWKFRCDCGNVVEKRGSQVVYGKIRSCGCLAKGNNDIAGKKFGMLTALEPTEKRCGTSVVWKFRCDCGNVVERSKANVIAGRTRSCGCLQRRK